MFQENKEINCHLTRNVAKKGLYIPQVRTKSYGRQSLKYLAAILWNNHLKYDDRINIFTNLKTFKKHLKEFLPLTMLINVIYTLLIIITIIIYYYYNYYYYYDHFPASYNYILSDLIQLFLSSINSYDLYNRPWL